MSSFSLRTDGVEPEIGQCADQAGASGRWEAIGAVAKFREQVENIGRHRPAQSTEAAEFGAGVVRHKQGVRPDRERWCRPKFSAPQTPGLSAAQFLRHHADRTRSFTGAACVLKRSVAAEFKLEIGDHDVTVVVATRARQANRVAA